MKGFIGISYPVVSRPDFHHLLQEYETTGKLPPVVVVEGIAFEVDSANRNGWAVSKEAVPKLLKSLQNVSLRIDHSESVRNVVGRVTDAWQDGNVVKFRAEVSDADLIPKILRGYLDSDSIQVDPTETVCSVCDEDVKSGKVKKEALLKEGLYLSREKDQSFRHLHRGAHERVLGGSVRELSLVTTPAYSSAKFEPIQVMAQ